jgi:hypothetical protein
LHARVQAGGAKSAIDILPNNLQLPYSPRRRGFGDLKDGPVPLAWLCLLQSARTLRTQHCRSRKTATIPQKRRSSQNADVLRQIPATDILNLHWMAGFIDYREFFGSLPGDLSLVWTLHDMNPFTGGCHFTA